MTSKEPVGLFYSYSHRDEEYREELETHLAILRRKGVIEEWHDRKLDAGDKWRKEIAEQLDAADVILLLVTPDFLASDFCYEEELERAIERHERGEAVVVPIIVRPVDFEDSPFAHLQALPTDAKPVTIWENRDEAWLSVSRGIRKVCTSAAELAGPDAVSEDAVEESGYEFDESDFGVLDFNAIMEERLADVLTTQEHVGKRSQEVNDTFVSETERLQELQEYTGPDKARKVRDIARSMGEHLSSYAKEMTQLATDLDESWSEVDRLFPRMIETAIENGKLSESSASELRELHRTLAEVEPNIETAKQSAEDASQAVEELGQHSVLLKAGARPAAKSMERFRDVYWGIQNSLGQMRRHVRETLAEHGYSVDSGNEGGG